MWFDINHCQLNSHLYCCHLPTIIICRSGYILIQGQGYLLLTRLPMKICLASGNEDDTKCHIYPATGNEDSIKCHIYFANGNENNIKCHICFASGNDDNIKWHIYFASGYDNVKCQSCFAGGNDNVKCHSPLVACCGISDVGSCAHACLVIGCTEKRTYSSISI